MQSDAQSDSLANSCQQEYRSREIEVAIRSSLTVDDCIVIKKQTQNLKQEFIAYVVPSALFAKEALLSHLQTILPNESLPTVVPVSTLPLTLSGEIDQTALSHMEIADITTAQQWEEQIKLVPEVEQVAVVVIEQLKQQQSLRLSDLLFEWKTLTREQSNTPVRTQLSHSTPKQDSSSSRLAISHGKELKREKNAPKVLSQALQQTVVEYPEKQLIYIQSDDSQIVQSYQDLLLDAQKILTGLRKLGLKPLDKVIFQIPQSQDFIPAFWGCILGGFIPVPISIAPSYEQVNSAVNKLQSAWQMLKQPIVLTSSKLASSLEKLPKLLNLENFQVETVDNLRQNQPDENIHQSQEDDLALILLTSGSTGSPKGVMLNHRNLLSMTAGTAQMNDFNHQDITLNWMPLEHVGAIVFLGLMAVDLGCQQIHVSTEYILQNPIRWLELIQHHKASISWAPNFAFSLLNERASEINQRSWDLSSMRFLVNAGEQIVPKTARSFLKLLQLHGLPSNAIHPAFGMSETCSGITWSDGFSLENSSDDMSFVELGPPIPGASIRITDDNNQIVAEGVIGKFQVKGLSVTTGYYENPQRNREAFTPDGWFNTGDIGYLESGRIVLTGRDKDDIIINGINYYSHEIESVVEEVEGVEVSYTAACAVRVGENAEQLAIFFSSTISDQIRVKELIKKIRGTVVKNIGVNPNYIIPVKKEMIPKTAIGKIQRSQLSRMFSNGEFDNIIQQLGIHLDNPNLLPDWFYRPCWRRKQAVTQIHSTNGQFLIFLDQLGLGESLGTELKNHGQQWIGIEAGVDFKQLSNNRYSVAPNNPEHYLQLLSVLKANNFQIDKIIHLWTYESGIREISSLESLEGAQTYGVYSLLCLTKALSNIHKSHQTIDLLVVSNNTQLTSTDEEIAYEKSPLLGLVKVIAQEIPNLTTRHIDLSVDEPAVNAKLILQEMHVLSGEDEVAYRHGQRWIPRLEKVDFRALQKQDVVFKPGGMYLISGGLGGVGVEIAKYLLKHYKARVLLIGRTSLPERTTWETYRGHKDAIAQKIAAYQELEQLGGDIAYETVDVCDLQALQQVVEQALNCWGCQLDGVLHLAGTYQERSLLEENQQSWSAALRAKVGGAWVINQLLKDYPQAFVISFSSVSSFLGGATVGAFVCANQFLESFAHYQRTQCGIKSYCFSWSLWDGIGISQDTQRSKLATSKGYSAITPRQGLYSMLVGLHHNQVQLFIGLDGSNRHIRRHVEDTYPLEKLTAYFTASSDSSLMAQLSKLGVRDRFGSPSTSDFVQLQQMPLTKSGTIDREKLTKGKLSELPNNQAQPATDIERQVAQIWQEVLGLESVGIHDNFFELGGHSLLLVQAQSKLQELFGSNVSIVDMFKYPSISTLAKYLSQGQTESASVLQGQKRAKVRSQSNAAHQSDIAVIGMSCRFPGANNIDEFWQNLCNGVESISFFTTEEIIATGVDPALVKNPHYVKAKPILSDVESFDADFFGYSTKEAELMDPQQRLLLECAWESLENAGYNPLTYDGAIGIYAGAVMNTYLLNNIYPNRHHLDVNDNLHIATMDSMGGLQMMIANDKDYLTTKISYKLNLTGPSVNVQTACSTSLVAIHMACGSLLSGESDMALAGGVSVHVPQKVGHLYQEGMIVSPDGHCRAFDAGAQGTIFGSGAGIVVLKRLEDALADGDNIYAVVKGSAVNNDGGTKVGYMAPNGDGQAAVVTEAMAMAGIDANTISYVEAHGTGTPLGDPIEIGGLTQAFRAFTQEKNFCAIGSVKTNVGHLQIASGVVGFMKTVLSLYHKKLPPSLHFDVPNPQLDLPNTPFYVNTTLKDWQVQDYPRRAGVNSLGIGGTNAHVILEEAPEREWGSGEVGEVGGGIEGSYYLLALSAKNEQALAELKQRYLQFLTSNSEVSVADVCYTANTGREHFNHRLAVVADSREKLVAQLGDWTMTLSQLPNQKTPKIAFLFTGQGSQYLNMGRQLYNSQPLFRQTIEQCNEILRPYLERSLLEVLYPTQAGEEVSLLLNQTAFTQPALFAFEYALYQLWKSWGIEPDVVMGHSVGEYVAATVAGVFSLEDGLKLIAQRGRLMQQLPDNGEMVSLMASDEFVRKVIAPFRNTVAIAAINGSSSVVISGAREDIAAICEQLSTLSVKTKRLEVSHAFHSPLMSPMLKEFEQVANGVTYNLPQIPLVSNVTGELADENIATPQYWISHISQCVFFDASIKTLGTLGCEVFLELGPKPILLGMGRECLPDSAGLWLPSVRPGVPEWQQLLSSLGELYVQGAAVDWLGFEGDYPHKKVPLPNYPFQRQRCWIENIPTRHEPVESLSAENIQTAITNFLKQGNTQELVELVQKSGSLSSEQIKRLLEPLAVVVREHKQHHDPDNIQDLCYELVWRNQGDIQQQSIGDYIPTPSQLRDRLEPLAEQLMSQHYQDPELLLQLEALSIAYITTAFQDMGWNFQVGQSFSFAEIVQQLGVVSQHLRLIRRLLEMLVEVGILEQKGEQWCVVKTSKIQTPQSHLSDLLSKYPDAEAELTLLKRCGSNLAQVITGERNPLELLFPEGDLTTATQFYENAQQAKVINSLTQQAVLSLIENLPPGHKLRVLEIGAGTGGTTSYLLPSFNAQQTEYVFTDVSPFFLAQAQQKFQNFSFVNYQLLDIEQEPHLQGFEHGSYNLIVAANVLHATKDLHVTLQHLHKLLAPQGMLLLLEGTVKARWLDLVFGLTEGWWRFSDFQLRPNHPLLTAHSWQKLLHESDFKDIATIVPSYQNVISQQAMIVAQAAKAKEAKAEPENWLIFADNQGIGQQLSLLLRSQQKACTVVFPGSEYKQISEQEFSINPASPEDFRRLLLFIETEAQKNGGSKSLPNPQLHGVVYLWSLDATEANTLTITDLEVASLRGCGGVLYLIQSLLVNQGSSRPPSLWLVTKGAQRVGVESVLEGVAQSSVWGLGKVITNEHPEFNCTLVDLDPQENDNTHSLFAEICSHKPTSGESYIAFRNGQRYVNRLVQNKKIVKQPLLLEADATYLITGGLGEIGLLVAQWLFELGAKYLVLAGRSSPNESASAMVRRLEAAGTQVAVIQTDVSQETDVASLLTQIKGSMPPLRGIIHTVGIFDDRLLVDHQWELFAKVFAPKVSGAWNLHIHTKDLPLDFFVLFSSVASLLGSAGLANYAAANAFLDALAHYRKSLSLPGLSINWGPWSMVGMAKAVGSKGEVRWATKGIKPIEPQQALSILEDLFSIDATQVGVMQLNWSTFLQQFSNSSYPNFFSEIAPQVQKVASTQVVQHKVNEPQLLNQIKASPPEQGQSLLMNYLREHIARVLGITALSLNVDEPLNKMGLDSLMVVEFRNRLRTELEVNIPITKFLDGVNVVGLTQFIRQLLVEDNSTLSTPFPPTTTSIKKSRMRGKL